MHIISCDAIRRSEKIQWDGATSDERCLLSSEGWQEVRANHTGVCVCKGSVHMISLPMKAWPSKSVSEGEPRYGALGIMSKRMLWAWTGVFVLRSTKRRTQSELCWLTLDQPRAPCRPCTLSWTLSEGKLKNLQRPGVCQEEIRWVERRFGAHKEKLLSGGPDSSSSSSYTPPPPTPFQAHLTSVT